MLLCLLQYMLEYASVMYNSSAKMLHQQLVIQVDVGRGGVVDTIAPGGVIVVIVCTNTYKQSC
jgi:hypothetical protein